tara:strand:+ start:9095 stop:9445 length:351 start_codon:yes stop_codon:yes gene_type:complete
MNKNIEQIRHVSEKLAENEDVKALSKELDYAQSFKSILSSDTGQVLIEFLIAKVANNFRNILHNDYSENHIGLLNEIAESKASLNLLSELKSSKDGANNLQESLDNLISELAEDRY